METTPELDESSQQEPKESYSSDIRTESYNGSSSPLVIHTSSNESSSMDGSSESKESSDRAESTNEYSSDVSLSSDISIGENNEINLREDCLNNIYQLPDSVPFKTFLYDKEEKGDFIDYYPPSTFMLDSTLDENGLPKVLPAYTVNAEIHTWWDPAYAYTTLDTTIHFIVQKENQIAFIDSTYFPLTISKIDTIGWTALMRQHLISNLYTKRMLDTILADSLINSSDQTLFEYSITNEKSFPFTSAIFSTHMQAQFIYNGDSGQSIAGEADDNLIVYMNHRMVLNFNVDRSYSPDTVSLDSFFLKENISIGDTVAIDIFHTDNRRVVSELNLTLNLNCILYE